MRIEGSFEVGAPIERTFRELRDAGLMARCVPGCDAIERESASRYRARVTVDVGSIHATFNLTVEITQEDPPNRVISRTRGDEGSRASMLAADNTVSLVALGANATRVQYVSEVAVTGRLGKFALGVMKKKVESLGQEFATRFRTALEERLSVDQSLPNQLPLASHVVPTENS